MMSNFALTCENPLPASSIDEVAAAREHIRRAREHLGCAYLLTGGDQDVEDAIQASDAVFDRCTLSLLEQHVSQTELAATCERAYARSSEECLCL